MKKRKKRKLNKTTKNSIMHYIRSSLQPEVSSPPRFRTQGGGTCVTDGRKDRGGQKLWCLTLDDLFKSYANFFGLADLDLDLMVEFRRGGFATNTATLVSLYSKTIL